MIRGELIGSVDMVESLAAKQPALLRQMTEKITRLTVMLQATVKDKLDGDVLHVKTGRLRRSINMRIDGADSVHVDGVVGTNVIYGAVHELGGTFTVREHLRMMTQAFGRPVKNPREITVRAHTATFPERSFLRSSLQDMQDAIKAEFQS